MAKKTYYVSIAGGEISQVKTANTYSFEIQATDAEVEQLRAYFNEAYGADWKSFWRAHVPFLEYHHDPQNDEYEDRLQKAYKLIYDLTDNETQEMIAQMGIINGL
ncbi:hydrolase [Ectobacillus ponti]|uniref:Hydrolase n=1 Tax=Ectobacillus ponti TaxID=2961894 RepID=A0AA41X2T6_9BACI|nr:hydrolase [Ectobacillus ponti]MCP8967577.1 hydrolase [Ectobacillus ponti]